jgi:hypothetical protein
MEEAQAKFDQERQLIEEYLTNDEREQALLYLNADFTAILNRLRRQLSQLEAELDVRVHSIRRIYRRIVSASWVYRASRRQLRAWLREPTHEMAVQVLAVCPVHSPLLGILEPISGQHLHLTLQSFLEGVVQALPQATPQFDFCLIDVSDLEPPRLTEALEVLAARARTILIHWHDQGRASFRSVHKQIVQFTLDRGCAASVYYSGSWASAHARRALHEAKDASAWRGRALPLAQLGGLTILAELRERARRSRLTTVPAHCSSAAFRLQLPLVTLGHSDDRIPTRALRLVARETLKAAMPP